MNRWIEYGKEILRDPQIPVGERTLMEAHLTRMLTDAQPGQPIIPAKDIKRAKETLVKDGAVIYTLGGETIRDQQRAKRPFWYVTAGFEVDGKNRVFDFPSRVMEVAIYPDPDRFFVPGSFDKNKAQ